jgi:hypothetical protein
MDLQVLGAGSQDSVELQADPTHQAIRESIRPLEHTVLGIVGGHYGVTTTTGLLAAQTAANSQIFAVRFVSSSKLMVLLKLYCSLHVTTAYSAAANVVPADFELYLARSYTVNATGGGTALVPSSISQLARGSMAPSEFVSNGQIYPAATGALTPGTQTLDSHPYSYATAGAPGVALGSLGEAKLFDASQWGKHPLVFGSNQGFVIRITQQLAGAAGTGVCRAVMAMEWVEVAAY